MSDWENFVSVPTLEASIEGSDEWRAWMTNYLEGEMWETVRTQIGPTAVFWTLPPEQQLALHPDLERIRRETKETISRTVEKIINRYLDGILKRSMSA